MSKNEKKRTRPTLAEVRSLRRKLDHVRREGHQLVEHASAAHRESVTSLETENKQLRETITRLRTVAAEERDLGIKHGEEFNNAKGLLALALQDLPRPSVLSNQIWRFLGFQEEPLLPTRVQSALACEAIV